MADALAAVLDALDRGKAIVPTRGGVLVELNAGAYTHGLAGDAVMVCDADELRRVGSFDWLLEVAQRVLDTHYPAALCDRDSPDPGPRLAAALRDCLGARTERETAT